MNHDAVPADHARLWFRLPGSKRCHGCGDLPNFALRWSANRIREVGVVEEIEEVRPEE